MSLRIILILKIPSQTQRKTYTYFIKTSRTHRECLAPRCRRRLWEARGIIKSLYQVLDTKQARFKDFTIVLLNKIVVITNNSVCVKELKLLKGGDQSTWSS